MDASHKCQEHFSPSAVIANKTRMQEDSEIYPQRSQGELDMAQVKLSVRVFCCCCCCFLISLIYLFIYLFLAVLGLRFCVRAFSSCGKRGPLFIVVRGPLTIAASLAAEHRLQTRRLSSRGTRAQLLRGMWDPLRPGLEPMSPALAGRFSTIVPPGKPMSFYFEILI